MCHYYIIAIYTSVLFEHDDYEHANIDEKMQHHTTQTNMLYKKKTQITK